MFDGVDGVIECDVLVVGAGPAGAVAALYCAKNGLDTVLIEKNRGIGKHTKTKIDASPADEVTEIINELKLKTENLVHKSRWYSPDGNSFTLYSEIGEYYFKRGPDADSFECSTVDKALGEGCKLFINSTVKEVIKDRNKFERVVILNQAKETTVKPKIIIAADGRNSFFHRFVEKKIIKKKIVGYGVTGVNFVNPDVSEIYFDAELAPGGYFYMVTSLSGFSSAAIVLEESRLTRSVRTYFDEFISKNPEVQDKIKSSNSSFSGYGCIFRLPEHVSGNLIFVGNAGGLIDPFMGYGMMPAIVSGYYAGKYSVEAISKDDLSLLENYEMEVRKRFDNKSVYFYRRIFESLDNEDLNLVLKMTNQLDGRIDVDRFLHSRIYIKGLLCLSLIVISNLPRSALFILKIPFKLLKCS